MRCIDYFFWASSLLFTSVSAFFENPSDKCAIGEYWCQDRCGSNAYGQQCCLTPNEQVHVLCGAGTTCCGYGCCPQGYVCNIWGGCDDEREPTSGPTSLPSSVSTTGPTTEPPKPSHTTVTTTQSNGQTVVIIDTTITVIVPTGSSLTTFTTSGVTITWNPTAPSTTTNSNGQTVISSPGGGVVTLSTGITSPTTITSDGQTITYTPPPHSTVDSTTTNSNGQTIIGTLTIPTGITTATTITTDGQTITFSPSTGSSLIPTTTVVTSGEHTFTIPTGISTPITTTTDGSTFTFFPVITRTNSEGQTIISSNGPDITIPTGITAPTTITNSNGEPVITYTPPITTPPEESTTSVAGVIFPISTPVPSPRPEDDGTDIPCDLWFFSICIDWPELPVLGWKIQLPPGPRPPGPPPPIRIPSGLSFTIDITGKPPPWPSMTIGPDRLPTYSPEPTPCETQTAEMCITKTSLVVTTQGSGVTTTDTQILSTCATMFGCAVEDSSETTTETSGCTRATSTVTDIWVSCPVSGSSTLTTGCITTSSAVTSGCDIKPTTITCSRGLVARATDGVSRHKWQRQTSNDEAGACEMPHAYIVWPKDSKSQSQNDATQRKLRDMAIRVTDVVPSETKLLGLNFWRVPLGESQADMVRGWDNVGNVILECVSDCPDPTTATASRKYDSLVANQLALVSWPDVQPPLTMKDLDGKYYFDASLGGGVDVYLLDSGANLENAEFSSYGLRDRVKWIQVGRDFDRNIDNDAGPENEQPHDDSQTHPTRFDRQDFKSHGSSMLSLLAGNTLGVAKLVNPILVRMPRKPGYNFFTWGEWIEGLGKVSDSLGTENSQVPKAVLLLAEAFNREAFVRKDPEGIWIRDPDTDEPYYDTQDFTRRAGELLANIIAKGVVVVTGAGNSLSPAMITGWPALFGKRVTGQPYFPEMIVVGATEKDGSGFYGRYDFANGLPHVFAPGLMIRSANGNWNGQDPNGGYRDATGTSCAAAMTAGLAAYFIRLMRDDILPDEYTHTVQGVKDYILSKRWKREGGVFQGNDLNSIFNGATYPRDQYCPWIYPQGERNRRGLENRQESTPTSASCRGGTTSSTSSSTSSSISSSTTSTSSTARPTPTTPLTVAERPTCNNEGDFPGHADVNGRFQTENAIGFCFGLIDNESGDFRTLSAGDEAIKQVRYDWDDISYTYSIEWIKGCVTTVQKQNVGFPLGLTNDPDDVEVACHLLLQQDYLWCTNNGGVGGYIDAGCLRYRFDGAR